MDKKIQKSNKINLVYLAAITGCFMLVVVTLYNIKVFSGIEGPQQEVERKDLDITLAKIEKFEDTLNVLGNLMPKTTFYLDAVSGGRVEEKYVEQGDYVEKGQQLVRLSNTSLQMSVFGLEAQVIEQLNFFRNTQMLMEANSVGLKLELLENKRQLIRLNRKIEQILPLIKKGSMAKDKLAEYQEERDYFLARQKLSEQRKEQEDSIIKAQKQQLEKSVKAQQESLQFVRAELNSLLVRAPVSGQLSEFNIEIGQSKSVGIRLGKIDVAGQFKVIARIDEYYLADIIVGMKVNILFNGESFNAQISKIDSRVSDAKFIVEVDMPEFPENEKTKLTWGQSLEMEILLTESNKNVVVIKKGPFYQTTGGHWVFVVNKDNTNAVRRQIILGKNNQKYFEVIDGLKVGEQVITSSYSNFDKSEVLYLN